MSKVFEFTTFVQFEADDEDEARDKLAAYLADPAVDCYALGLESPRGREVEEEA